MKGCKIEKNSKGKIVSVLDQSGNPSTLFKQILNAPTLALNEAINVYKNVYSGKLKDKVKFQQENNIGVSAEEAVKRNNGNLLNLAPNGKPSILYKSYQDLGYNGAELDALVAQVYSDEFGDWFGKFWENHSIIDKNFNEIIAELKIESYDC